MSKRQKNVPHEAAAKRLREIEIERQATVEQRKHRVEELREKHRLWEEESRLRERRRTAYARYCANDLSRRVFYRVEEHLRPLWKAQEISNEKFEVVRHDPEWAHAEGLVSTWEYQVINAFLFDYLMCKEQSSGTSHKPDVQKRIKIFCELRKKSPGITVDAAAPKIARALEHKVSAVKKSLQRYVGEEQLDREAREQREAWPEAVKFLEMAFPSDGSSPVLLRHGHDGGMIRSFWMK